MGWQDKIQVKKGNIGESIVLSFLEKKGYCVYMCVTEGAHVFDMLAIKDKKVFIVAEVKSKARMNKFDATGINVSHMNEYLHVLQNQGMDVILFFVDEHPKSESIYCQALSELIKPKTVDNVNYPNYDIAKGVVLFSLSDMKHVCKLTGEQLDKLKQASTRNYEYK